MVKGYHFHTYNDRRKKPSLLKLKEKADLEDKLWREAMEGEKAKKEIIRMYNKIKDPMLKALIKGSMLGAWKG